MQYCSNNNSIGRGGRKKKGRKENTIGGAKAGKSG